MKAFASLFKPNVQRLQAKSDVDGLVSALSHSDATVKKNAAEALGEIGDPGGTEGLLRALQDAHATVRVYAAEALGKIGDTGGTEGLLSALQDARGNVRLHAARALGKIRDPRAVAMLVAALRDKDEYVRANAAGALGNIGDPRAIDALIAALEDSTQFVRGFAVDALTRFQVEKSLAAIRDYREREEAKKRRSKEVESEEMRPELEPAGMVQRAKSRGEVSRPIKRIFVLVNRKPADGHTFVEHLLTDMPTKYLDELQSGENRIFLWEVGDIEFDRPGAVHMALLLTYSSVFNTVRADAELPAHKLTFASFEATMGVRGSVVAQFV